MKHTAAHFVKVVQESPTIADASKALDMAPGSVHSRIYQFRKAGVQIKQFPRARGGQKLDIAALNAVAAGALKP